MTARTVAVTNKKSSCAGFGSLVHHERSVVVPMDHGVTLGPVPGLESLRHAAGLVARGGADAVVVHKGQAKWAQVAFGPRTALIVHLSASLAWANVNSKVLVCTVEEALRLADGVNVHVNVGGESEGASTPSKRDRPSKEQARAMQPIAS